MQKIPFIQVFNLQINGVEDIQKFCRKSPSEKFAWIKKNVQGVSDAEIDSFLSQELKTQKQGCGCGPQQPKTNATDKPSGVPETAPDAPKFKPAAKNRRGRNPERGAEPDED